MTTSMFASAAKLQSTLGTFWSKIFGAPDQVQSLAAGRQVLGQQLELELQRVLDSLSRQTVQPAHQQNWVRLQLLASECVTPVRPFDDTENFDAGWRFGDTTTGFSFPLPAGLQAAAIILNRVTWPSLWWQNVADFRIVGDRIQFRSDPREDIRIAQVPVYVDGEEVDTQLTLWLYGAEFRTNDVSDHFGCLLDLQAVPGSQAYRDIVNALLDCLVSGPTVTNVLRTLATITDTPLATAPGTVTAVLRDKRSLHVITETDVYSYPLTAIASVAVGDVISVGQQLVDTVTLVEIRNGLSPDWLRGIAVGPQHLASCFLGELLFENREVPLVVQTNTPSHFTRLSFELGGFPADQTHFFDLLHQRGVTEAIRPIAECEQTETITHIGTTGDAVYRRATLAHRLDTREIAIGEPTSGYLPTTVNPLQLLLSLCGRSSTAVVRIKVAGLRDASRLHYLRELRRTLPSHVFFVVVLELTTAPDAVTLSQAADYLQAGVATEPLTDTVNGVDAGLYIARCETTCR